MTAPAGAAALAAAYDAVTAVVLPLTDDDLLRPTRCRGWVIADVVHHLLQDARRALVTFASPAPGPSDVDHVSYWSAYPGSGDAAASQHNAWLTRRAASAYDRPSAIVAVWASTAPAAARAAAAADATSFVATQGHVLSVPDFVATLVTEAVVHHLDLTVDLPSAPEPPASALAVAVSTMDGLLSDEVVRPVGWSSKEFLLKASGREALTPRDRVALGEAAGWFPLLS
ncbi:maleylpyruvate isomerase N-terminal domain-containing protein [Asanoa sp. WMMD1127]|uniref:maleylpyruvate isomerase N-terminal domain-containing protein n=1 Tax=Asanoa sp. WMMD1127 TaxID=3016107 RepID=UPI002416C035|nr:maleylpyruvate isomerase N-terminal domain-containing protein [Asanoa sp. WMMD1127]MDG4822132.1 maleylpyruvate isomerase N-terminal domain-containing protein [Asanoa sp. WMMD1127]